MIDRRKFNLIALTAIAAGAVAGLSFYGEKSASAKTPLRLPGALNEKSFLASCVKCGQCLQVCPYHSVRLLDADEGLAAGTPIIQPEKRGCYLCDLLPCVLACPSGALDHDIDDAHEVKMGVAFVAKPERCLAKRNQPATGAMIRKLIAHGDKSPVEKALAKKLAARENQPCDLCERFCPYPEKQNAIQMKNGLPEIQEHCAGCGVCEELCPAGVIKILPRKNYHEVYEAH
jgi:ferredoxin-type protein NapG